MPAMVYVGGTSGSGTGASYTVSLSGTLTGGVASSPSPGDVVVVFAGHGATASSAPTCSGNNSGAYTGVHTALYSNDTWDVNVRAFYFRQGASVDTTLTIGRANNTTHGGATVVHVWRNVDEASPIAGTPATTSANNQNGAALNPPALDPGVTGAVILAGGTGMMPAAGTAGYTGLSGMSNVITSYGDGSTADASTIAGTYEYAGVSYDPPAATGGTQNNASSSWAAVTFALRPAADPPTELAQSGSVAQAAAATVSGNVGMGQGLAQSGSVSSSAGVAAAGDIAIEAAIALSQSGALQMAGSATVAGGLQVAMPAAEVRLYRLAVDNRLALQADPLALSAGLVASGDAAAAVPSQIRLYRLAVDNRLALQQTAPIGLSATTLTAGDIGYSVAVSQAGAVALAGAASLAGGIGVGVGLSQAAPAALSAQLVPAADAGYGVVLSPSGALSMSAALSPSGAVAFGVTVPEIRLYRLAADNYAQLQASPVGLAAAAQASANIGLGVALQQSGAVSVGATLAAAGSVAAQTPVAQVRLYRLAADNRLQLAQSGAIHALAAGSVAADVSIGQPITAALQQAGAMAMAASPAVAGDLGLGVALEPVGAVTITAVGLMASADVVGSTAPPDADHFDYSLVVRYPHYASAALQRMAAHQWRIGKAGRCRR